MFLSVCCAAPTGVCTWACLQEVKPVLLGCSPPALSSVYSQSSGTDREIATTCGSAGSSCGMSAEKKRSWDSVVEKRWVEGGERGVHNYMAEQKLISSHSKNTPFLFSAERKHTNHLTIAPSTPLMSSFGRKQSIRQRSAHTHLHHATCTNTHTCITEGGRKKSQTRSFVELMLCVCVRDTVHVHILLAYSWEVMTFSGSR